MLPTLCKISPVQVSFIAIIDLGYVGLPLFLRFARSGVPVPGLDIDPAKADTREAIAEANRPLGDDPCATGKLAHAETHQRTSALI